MSSNKYLIVGLGNIGAEYAETRHNIGFMVLDYLAEALDLTFHPKRYGDIAEGRLKNKQVLLLNPSTYMNLSGNSIRYWLKEAGVPLENLLVIVDEIAIPFSSLRMNLKGSAGGHNGLKHIESTLGTQQYNRLRIGIGSDYPRGGQVDFVLSPFTKEEQIELPTICKVASEMAKSFCLAGVEITMSQFNKKSKK